MRSSVRYTYHATAGLIIIAEKASLHTHLAKS